VITTSSVHSPAWWRPQATPRVNVAHPQAVAEASAFLTAGASAKAVRRKKSGASTASTVAFRALVAFTIILLLSPQAWFPALGHLRIAFVAAVVAIGAHLLDRMVHGRGDAPPFSAETGIALLLVAWR